MKIEKVYSFEVHSSATIEGIEDLDLSPNEIIAIVENKNYFEMEATNKLGPTVYTIDGKKVTINDPTSPVTTTDVAGVSIK